MDAGTVMNQKLRVPYINTKDCSLGICSFHCLQWCNIPPPPFQEFPEHTSGSYFTPLVITIIGVLVGAFLLISYYAILSKYCMNRSPPTVADSSNVANTDSPSTPGPYYVTCTGLDEAQIQSIPVCEYKKGAMGLSNSTDCSVCLTEFEESENLRVLPKCSHTFHIPCIDQWLKTRSDCPLCRANVAFVDAQPKVTQRHCPSVESSPQSHADVAERVANESRVQELEATDDASSPSSSSVSEVVIEVRDVEIDQHVRRSCPWMVFVIPGRR